MRTGKIFKENENSWIIKSDDNVYKINEYHSFWLKIWGEEGMDISYELDNGIAQLKKVGRDNLTSHPRI
jgi:hypothetical protein